MRSSVETAQDNLKLKLLQQTWGTLLKRLKEKSVRKMRSSVETAQDNLKLKLLQQTWGTLLKRLKDKNKSDMRSSVERVKTLPVGRKWKTREEEKQERRSFPAWYGNIIQISLYIWPNQRNRRKACTLLEIKHKLGHTGRKNIKIYLWLRSCRRDRVQSSGTLYLFSITFPQNNFTFFHVP